MYSLFLYYHQTFLIVQVLSLVYICLVVGDPVIKGGGAYISLVVGDPEKLAKQGTQDNERQNKNTTR
jgi:hypothetical protein